MRKNPMHQNQRQQQVQKALLRLAQLLQSLSIMSKETMMMNGQLLSSSTPNCSRKRSSWKKLENKSSRRKWKDNWISSYNKRRRENRWKPVSNKSTNSFNSSKLKLMIREKNKRNKNMRKKSNSRKKWEINKSRMRTRERRRKRKDKINLITY